MWRRNTQPAALGEAMTAGSPSPLLVHRRARGFSMTETLVVIGITGIFAAIALPAMGSLIGKNRIAAVTNEFVFSLQTARSEAIKRLRPVVVCPSIDPEAPTPACAAVSYASGWITYVDANSNGTIDTGEPVLLRQQPSEGEVGFVATGVAARVRFDGRGSSIQDSGAPLPGTLTITVGDSKRLVRVRANGRVDSQVL